MKFRRCVVTVGVLLTLASCTADKNDVASSEPGSSNPATSEVVVETTKALNPEEGADVSAGSAKTADVLAALDGSPEATSGVGLRNGKGPCPLFDVVGATANNQAGTWNLVVKPAVLSCKLSDGVIGIARGDVFGQGVADAKASGDEVREFAPVPFANGSINSICTPRECSAVWTDSSMSVFRSAADRETALTWLKSNLATVFGNGASVDAKKLELVVAPTGPVASKDMVEVFRAQLSGDYETYWSYLYPEQQKQIRKDVFIRCLTQPIPATLPQITANNEQDRTADLGVADKNAKVVTLLIKSDGLTSTKVVYTLLAEGKWRWLLGTQELAAFAKGNCK
jgi:hypothetical protein